MNFSGTIGFIGQGYVGKNYADDFESRGFRIVRYALEEPYVHNKDKIKLCDIVFIAVPTPTTPEGFDARILEGTFSLTKEDAIIVIKSTILPGMTEEFQKKYSTRTFLFSPEFLREASAREDAAHPYSIIVGTAGETKRHAEAAEVVMSILPDAPSKITCTSTEAELIKYTQNVSGYIDIITFNVFYDLAEKLGARWEPILRAMKADPNIPSRFANPVHKSGRGAGGHCLIKDMAALRGFHERVVNDPNGAAFLRAAEEKNKRLLVNTKKDLDLLEGVYGPQ